MEVTWNNHFRYTDDRIKLLSYDMEVNKIQRTLGFVLLKNKKVKHNLCNEIGQTYGAKKHVLTI